MIDILVVTRIGSHAFCSCDNLRKIVIPAGVTLDPEAIIYCDKAQIVLQSSGNAQDDGTVRFSPPICIRRR